MIEALLAAEMAAAAALGSYLGRLVLEDLAGNESLAQQLGIARAHMVVAESLLRVAATEKDPAKLKAIYAQVNEVAKLADATLKQAPADRHVTGTTLGDLLRSAKVSVAKFLAKAAGAIAAGAKGALAVILLMAAGFGVTLAILAKKG